MQSKAFTINKPEKQTASLFLPFTISIICHAVLIVVLILDPNFSTRKREMPNVISVSMVSMSKKTSAAPKAASSEKKESAPPKKASEAAQPLPLPKAEPESKTESPDKKDNAPRLKRIKRSLKKKTFKSEKVVKSAIKDLEKKVEDTRPDPTAAAFASIRKKVKAQEEARAKEQAALEFGGGEGDERVEGGDSTGQGRAELIDMYRLEIAHEVQKNWAFLGQMAEVDSNLQALLVFKVMPNGEIRDVFFTDRSGNSFLDESAYRAVIKSDPVEPHPRGIVAPYVEMGLRFTPQGVK